MAEIRDQRPFLPTKDLARSLDFYTRMGWAVRHRGDEIALIEQGGSRLLLQRYFQKDWAENTMLHLLVDDAAAWHERAMQVKAEGGFDEVRIRAPQREDYGAMVTHVIDPAGVLLHFAQFDD
jgi:catechol 2,3-dioxygenase-like lactoylglutathione lyase family enzyme